MSAGFKVGEVVILQNAIFYPRLNGAEATVVSLAGRGRFQGRPYSGIEIDLIEEKTGLPFVVFPHQIRKKHPPRSAKSIMREVIAKAKRPCEVPA